MRRCLALFLALTSGTGLFSAAPPPREKQPSPLYAKVRLIAGGGDPALRDGHFIKAAFKGPKGLTLSEGGETLFVADSGNGAVRAIHLDRQNSVETLCTGLVNPTDLALSTDQGKLYIYDRGSRKIEVLALPGKTLSTAFTLGAGTDRGLEAIGLALTPGGSRLCFIDPVEGSLMIGDVKSGVLKAALKDPVFLEPGVKLLFSKDKLRCYSPVQHTILEFASDSKKFDTAALDAWKAGDVLTTNHKMEVASGLVGMASLGDLAYPGMVCWDPVEANIQFYENLNDNYRPVKLSIRDYLMTDRSVGPNRLPYFKGPLNLAYDYARQVVYVSQYDSNQVSAVRDDTRGAAKYTFRHNHDFAAEKPVGVTRVLIFGSSLMFGSYEPENPGEYIPSQFEFYLNLMSSMQGSGRQFEVLYDIQQGLKNSGGEVTLLEHPRLLTDYHFDYVVFAVNEQSVWWDVNAWSVVPTEDDVPLQTLDPEWAAKDIKERAAGMGPAVKKMAAYCRENPGPCKDLMSFFPGGEPDFHYACGTALSFFENPRLKELSMEVEKKLAAKAVALCRRAGVKPIGMVMPNKGHFGGGERDITCRIFGGDFVEAEMAALESQGMPCASMLDTMRVLQPEVFPVWIDTDFHFLHRGQQWVGYLMAERFLDKLDQPAAGGH